MNPQVVAGMSRNWLPGRESSREKLLIPVWTSLPHHPTMYRNCNTESPAMKSTTIPPLRVSPELRREAEAVLQEGETLSAFMLESLQASIAQRRDQQAFVQRGLSSAEKARRTGRYLSADEVLDGLFAKLKKASARAAR